MPSPRAAALLSVLLGACAALAQDLPPPTGWSGSIVCTQTDSDAAQSCFDSPPVMRTCGSRQESWVWRTQVVLRDGVGTITDSYRSQRYGQNRITGVQACTWEEIRDPRTTVWTSVETDTTELGGTAPASCQLYQDPELVWIDCVPAGEDTPIRGTRTQRNNGTCTNCCESPRGTTTTTVNEPPATAAEQFMRGAMAQQELVPGEPLEALVGGERWGEDGGAVTECAWALYREGVYRVEVEVVDYDGWRPMGGPHEGERGNAAVVTATLSRRDGRPLDQQARRFRFLLQDRSYEPGVDMNWPPRASLVPRSPDLAFIADGNEDLELVGDDGREVRTPEGRRDTASATVSAFDWGAYGVLHVVAELEDGREVLGELKGQPQVRDVLLPKRASADDPIAEAWRRAKPGAGDRAADSDADWLPAGDGHAGDGLTLYEEYRGFHVNGEHVETRPDRKELFVRNDLGAHAKPGIQRYEAATGIDVIDGLTLEELERAHGRVINLHTSGRFHRVDQHAVVVVPAAGGALASRVVGRVGTPRQVDAVQVTETEEFARLDELLARDGGGLTRRGEQLATDLAHELGHSSGVWHHGEADPGARDWTAPSGVLLEGALPVTVFREDGLQVLPSELVLPTQHWVAAPHGQHSGDDGCLMRYDLASVHLRELPDARYLNRSDEPPAAGLCSGPEGTGVNGPGHAPRPRYGPAAPGRGGCRHQLCINDAHSHAPR